RRSLRAVLPLLTGQRLLRGETVAELDAAYRYLRRLENRLQQWRDEQTHRLPEDEPGRARLALAMGNSGWGELKRELDGHRARVAAHFEQAVFGPVGDRGDAPTFDIEASPELRLAALQALGLSEPGPVAELLEQLRGSAYYRRLDETG